MKCPRDGAVLLDARINGFVLKKCPDCKGLWLDQGVLEGLFELPGCDFEHRVRLAEFDQPLEQSGTAEYMHCPRCGDARLQGITFTYRAFTRIDRCERCLGVWLDQTELDAVLAEKRYLEHCDQDAVKFLQARQAKAQQS